jgi:hypothetical protein
MWYCEPMVRKCSGVVVGQNYTGQGTIVFYRGRDMPDFPGQTSREPLGVHIVVHGTPKLGEEGHLGKGAEVTIEYTGRGGWRVTNSALEKFLASSGLPHAQSQTETAPPLPADQCHRPQPTDT